MRNSSIALIFAISLAGVATAGYFQHVSCTTPGCGFKGDLYSGSGRGSASVSGFCVPCGKMVTLSIKRSDLKDSAPVPDARIWDAATGRTIDLYACPTCKKPFAPANQLSTCPKCGKKSISATETGKWD